jgi:hypothetical protein
MANRQITEDGVNWLIGGVDPFHDDKIHVPGYPDLNTVSSLVQAQTSTFNVSPASNVPANTTWDCHIFFLPVTPLVLPDMATTLDNNAIQCKLMLENNTIVADVAYVNLYPGWNCITVPTGTDWILTPPATNNANLSAGRALNKYASGHYRLISSGCEVHNTTAELYKGGSITAYRAPASRKDGYTASALNLTSGTGGAISVYSLNPVKEIDLPPSTQQEAALYPDTRTWEAEKGVYMVATQASMDNEFLHLSPSDVLCRKTKDYTTVLNNINGAVQEYAWGSFGGLNAASSIKLNAFADILPFDIVGCIFGGLNYNSTLQMTTKYYWERIPATTEPDILSLCQTASAYDPVAMELYSRALAEMPVAVPVDENPLGEWFSSLLDGFLAMGPKVGQVLNNIGTALGYKQAQNIPMKAPQQAQKKALPSIPKKQVQEKTTEKKKKKRNRKKPKNN